MRVLLLCLALTGCAATPKVERMLPPAAYLDDCPHPAIQTATNGQLAEGILAYREALKLCNNDKAALREWAKE